MASSTSLKDDLPLALITGASAGLGLATARALLRRGYAVILACRSRGEAARVALQTEYPQAHIHLLELDVSDLESVRAAAARLAETPLAVFIANAGMQDLGPVVRNRAGLERTFVTNHLGHFLLTRLVLAQCQQPLRVILVSSNTHDPRQFTGMPAPRLQPISDLAFGRSFTKEAASVAGRRRYTTSKLCNILCAYELHRRLQGTRLAKLVTVQAFDPGLMPGTGLARSYGPVARWFWSHVLPLTTWFLPNVNQVRTSAARLAELATAQRYAQVSGRYFSRGRPRPSSKDSYDEGQARALWELSSQLVELPPTL